MLEAITATLALALGAAAVRHAAGRQGWLAGRPPAARLRAIAGLAAAALLAARLMAGAPRPLALLLGAALAAVLAAAAAAIASLCLEGAGRRWRRFAAAPFALVAAIMAIGGLPVAVSALVLLPVALRMPWLTRRVGLGARTLLSIGALAAIAAGKSTAGGLPHLPGGMAAVLRLGAGAVFAFAGALLIRLAIQFPGRVFDRFRLRTRLVISYVLVAAVPVLLIAAFLVLASYLVMGSYRASLAARLLGPSPAARRALAAALDHPGFAAALAPGADSAPAANSWDRAVLAALPAGSFCLAARRDLPDTTRFTFRWSPSAALPPEAASLREPLPGVPEDALFKAGDRLYATAAVRRAAPGHELILRAFSPIDSQRVRDVARAIDAEIQVLTPDTLNVTREHGGMQVSIGGTKGNRLVSAGNLGSESKVSGSYFGVHLLTGWSAAPDGLPRQRDSLLLVKTPLGRILAALRDTAENPLNYAILLALAIFGGLFLAVEAAALAAGAAIARSIHRAVSVLHLGTRRLAEDHLDHRIELERGDELGELAGSFNRMAQGLEERRRLAVEREHMQGELLVAASIQRRLLPAGVPDIPGLDVAGTSLPSREVGGDSYDFLRWGDSLLTSIADVAGKGVPAAILMSNLQAGLRGQALHPGSLGRVLAALNELVLASTDPGRFITLAIALVDPKAGTVTYASAGHNPPLIRRAGGSIETLTAGGILLGVMPKATYEETRVPFGPGDVLVLYTDGVVEAIKQEGVFFGDDRLADVLRAAGGLGAAAVLDRIVEAVDQFAGEDGPGDDLTVVVVKRTAER